LEGIEINRQERRDAEIDYIKHFGGKWRSEGTELRFAVENPRYVELIQSKSSDLSFTSCITQ
jgi:hypothetical protein